MSKTDENINNTQEIEITPKTERKRISRKKLFRKISSFSIFIVVVGLALVLVIGQIINSTYTKIKTEIAFKLTISDLIEADGYIIRDEMIIESEANGVKTYAVTDGSRVFKGSTVINLFNSEDQAITEQKIESLQNQINELTALQDAKESVLAEPELINKQVEEKVKKLIESVNNGNISASDSLRGEIISSMSRYNIVTGDETDYNEKIDLLTRELESLKGKYSGANSKVSAPRSGYYISKTDGYENVLKLPDVLEMSPSDFENAVNAKEEISGYTSGKIINEYDWYFTVILSSTDIKRLNNAGKSMNIVLPFTSISKIPVEVAKINLEEGAKEGLVAFSCDYMSAELASLRRQPVQIILSEPTGIKISAKAVRAEEKSGENDDGKGIKVDSQTVNYVYVLVANQVKKRYVDIIFMDLEADIAICREVTGTDAETADSLRIYDEVIVEGKNLSDGKIIT